MANKISIIPVAYTTSILLGINSGIILDIPFVKIKCPRAVNNNIKAKAILPERKRLFLPKNSLEIRTDKQKLMNNTSSGFIYLVLCKILTNRKEKQ